MSTGRRAFLARTAAVFAAANLPTAAVAAQPSGSRPLWFVGSRLGTAGRALLREMREAHVRGLDPADYGADELERTIAGLESSPPLPGEDAHRLSLDNALSAAATRFVRHLERGRVDPVEAGYLMPVPRTDGDTAAVLHELANSTDVRTVLDRFEPPFLHFSLLKQALARYRALAAGRPLAELPPLPGRKLEAGGRWNGMPALRERLRAMGDLPSSVTASGDMLDEATVAALVSFQNRHGLAPDGILGPATLSALKVPFSRRVDQLLWSMERARWLPHPGPGPFILVNVPQYRLFAFAGPEDRESAMTPMNVIVGKAFPQNNTPIFTADLRYLVLRPYWDVPASIARRELLPQIRKDPGYFERERLELVHGQNDSSPVVPFSEAALDELAAGRLRLRQRPGRNNSLGRVKFMLPNPYNVYLHDTPARALFSQSRRAFSHGCVRVENPLALATFVMQSDGQQEHWPAERLEAEMNRESTVPLRLNLRRPIRVMLIYATALAAEDGRVLFFEDVYGHDAKLEALLARHARTRTAG